MYKMQETKIDITKTALLIVDMQNGLVSVNVLKKEPFDTINKAFTEMVKGKGIISNIAKVIAAARKVGMPIIFIKAVHRKDGADIFPSIRDNDWRRSPVIEDWRRSPVIEGTLGAEVTDELKPAPEDFIICKRKPNAFYNTDLETILRSQSLDTVIITGAVTGGCVANTFRGAEERNFNIIVLSDCCAARTAEEDEYFMKKVFPREAQVRTSDEIVAAMTKASTCRKAVYKAK